MTDQPWQRPAIPPLAQHLAAALLARIDAKTKPPGSLGRLEEIALRLGLMQGTTEPVLRRAHGGGVRRRPRLRRRGRQPVPARGHAADGGRISSPAAPASTCSPAPPACAVKVVDAGVAAELPPHPDLLELKVRAGTRNALHEPALTDAEVALCLARGAQVTAGLAAQGCNAILPGEMGIGNSSAAALLTSALAPLPLEQCVGIGAGHDQVGLARKLDVLQRVQQRHPDVHDPLAALAAFGGCEIAMMAGAEAGSGVAAHAGGGGRADRDRGRSGRHSHRPRGGRTTCCSPMPPATARTGWRWPRSAPGRCSTLACGWARAPAPRSPGR